VRAAVLHAANDLRVEVIADAPAAGAGEVRLKILLCGLCGTDVHEYASAPVMAPLEVRNPRSGHVGPMVLGHEFLGVVDQAGAGVRLSAGTRVVAGAGVWCGTCEQCARGRTNLCDNYYTFGLQANGGLSEFITVPAEMCVEVPEGCSDEDAVLAQPVSIALHAIQRAQIGAADRVGVIGAGGIGSLLTVGLSSTPNRGLVVFDIDASRLATAERLGAQTTVLVPRTAEEAQAQAQKLADSFDVVFDASGTRAGLSSALGLTRKGGRIVAVGLPSAAIEFDSRSAVIKEVDVITSSAHVCAVNLPDAVALLARRSIHSEIVDRVVPLENIVSEGFADLLNRTATGKVVVRITGREHNRAQEQFTEGCDQ
jgi:(R,R)-butanediol dehydrogenase/meso-butanediol dehydrogenase/diacetyl reductase